jgi:phosphatidylserine/phosphatidylglycerophosphate/cardiolipin synthase-like enzyme
MHLKFVVVDGEAIEAGSFKFTADAERKDAENVLALHDPAVAAQRAREWDPSLGGFARASSPLLIRFFFLDEVGNEFWVSIA